MYNLEISVSLFLVYMVNLFVVKDRICGRDYLGLESSEKILGVCLGTLTRSETMMKK